ncbi:MAG: biosynthetic-type acetolactate synthase large subunit [Deltaproteobacteria bacterium]|nr:MAG: biosynthetic-type acetolactate synthase large subunit [Deltaproteobacteria bacterium]
MTAKTTSSTAAAAQPAADAQPQLLTGAQIVVEALRAEGVDTVFGYPGGAILPTYDELYDGPFRHVLVRHEQGAVHMAQGYARVKGKPGVVIVTSGPGATNTVTGLTDAYMDSTPVIVLSGQVPTSLIGNDAFQEADIVGITRPCTKHNFLVKDVRDLARIIKQAFYIATSGRPGPVLIDLPKDVQNATCEYAPIRRLDIRGYRPTVRGNKRQVGRALDLLEQAERPLFYVGGGVQWGGSAAVLTELIRTIGAPVTTTLMALGTFPASDPRNVGMLGMHGGYWANMAVQHCDVLVAVAARFDDRVTGDTSQFAPRARGRIIHIDIDPSSIAKNVPVDVPIVGDVGNVLQLMLEGIAERPFFRQSAEKWTPWVEQIAAWKKERPLGYKRERDGAILPLAVFETLQDLTGGDAIVATDVGQHQMWSAQLFGFERPRSWLTSGGLGTMGYGLPAGIGAHFADPDRTVIVVSGDGSIQMNIQELSTAVQYKVPVKVVILNNRHLGMVRQWQDKFYERRFSQSYFESLPDFVKLAEAYGAFGVRATRPDELRPALERLFEYDGPGVAEVIIPPEEGVFPMVPAGMAVHEMLFA